jgi:methionyl-tRNA formyltransferase
MNKLKYAFFGTGALAESVLAALAKEGYLPTLLVTKPDSVQGRHMQLTAPHIKTWAKMKGIDVFQPDTLKELPLTSPLHTNTYDLFIVASYGKIIPEEILNIPSHGVLNVHPSLLPKYRGPSPIESVLLEGDISSGVTIMKLDKEMDHGPILLQQGFTIKPQDTAGTLEVACGQLGGELLTSILPHYMDGSLIPKEQDHTQVTICKKITKDQGEITLDTNAAIVQRKYRAFTPWPGIYFFIDHKGKPTRVKVTGVDTSLALSDSLVASDIILTVIPEGKKEMDFESFKRGYQPSSS